MARRSARRTYVRDGRGRFASTGTTTAKAKPAARRAQRGTNRITRDNSGKITGVGKNGATARGGRLRTAAGNQRGAVLDRMKRAPMAGTVGRGGKVRSGVKPVARPATPVKSARATVNGASQAKARLQRAMDNYDKKKYAVMQAETRLKKAKSSKASKALGKANRSLMTASQAVKYLKGNMNSDTLRLGSWYRAGNRDNVAATYSVKRVAGAFRPGKSRLVAPPKGARMGRAIPGSGGQIKATAKAARPAGTIRKKAASLAERKRANAVKKGLLTKTTEADKRSRAQILAREERKLAEMIKNPPRNKLYGVDRTAILIQKGYVERLREPIPQYQRRETSAIRQAARDNLARKKAGKEAALQARKRTKSYQVAQQASAYYRRTGTLPANQRKPGAKTQAKAGFKQSPSLARGERILSRLQAIGQGRAGRKARQSQIVRERAGRFYTAVAPYSLYERGAKAGQQRPSAEVLSGLAKNLKDKERVKKAQQIMSRVPASGIRQRLEQQGRRRGARGEARLQVRATRSGLGPMTDSQYRQSLSYGGSRPKNKVETTIAVRRRAAEFLSNPRSGQKLPALSRPAPQRKAAAPSPRSPQPAPKRDGIKATERQRARRRSAESRYGVRSTRDSMRFGIKGKRSMATIRSQAATRQRRRRENILTQTRTGVYGIGIMRKNPRIRAVDTGMSQLSLVGKPKKLKRYKPVK